MQHFYKYFEVATVMLRRVAVWGGCDINIYVFLTNIKTININSESRGIPWHLTQLCNQGLLICHPFSVLDLAEGARVWSLVVVRMAIKLKYQNTP